MTAQAPKLNARKAAQAARAKEEEDGSERRFRPGKGDAETKREKSDGIALVLSTLGDVCRLYGTKFKAVWIYEYVVQTEEELSSAEYNKNILCSMTCGGN